MPKGPKLSWLAGSDFVLKIGIKESFRRGRGKGGLPFLFSFC